MFVPSPYGQAFVTSTDGRRLPADPAADQHHLRLHPRPRSADPAGSQHPLLPDEQQIHPPGRARRHDRLSVQPGPPGLRRHHLADLHRPALAGLRRQFLAPARWATTPATCGWWRPIRSRSRSISTPSTPWRSIKSTYDNQGALPDPTLTPGLDFYNEYVWTRARRHAGGEAHLYDSTMKRCW